MREVGGETMVYDRRRHRAHCLEPVAAEVWRLWDGRSDPEAIARRASQTLERDVDADAVRIALGRLERAELIERSVAATGAGGSRARRSSSRRSALRRIGLGGLAVLSVAVPTPAQTAATCIPPGRECTRSVDCCGSCCSSNAHRCTGGPNCMNP